MGLSFVRVTAKVTSNEHSHTTGKDPEHHFIWLGVILESAEGVKALFIGFTGLSVRGCRMQTMC